MGYNNEKHFSQNATPRMNFEINGNVYNVGIILNKEGKETMKDKIDRLLRRDVGDVVFQSD